MQHKVIYEISSFQNLRYTTTSLASPSRSPSALSHLAFLLRQPFCFRVFHAQAPSFGGRGGPLRPLLYPLLFIGLSSASGASLPAARYSCTRELCINIL